eukprot:3569922-Alexandrium_andersonii.AAC.1
MASRWRQVVRGRWLRRCGGLPVSAAVVACSNRPPVEVRRLRGAPRCPAKARSESPQRRWRPNELLRP